jgi:hypothetical protein
MSRLIPNVALAYFRLKARSLILGTCKTIFSNILEKMKIFYDDLQLSLSASYYDR